MSAAGDEDEAVDGDVADAAGGAATAVVVDRGATGGAVIGVVAAGAAFGAARCNAAEEPRRPVPPRTNATPRAAAITSTTAATRPLRMVSFRDATYLADDSRLATSLRDRT